MPDLELLGGTLGLRVLRWHDWGNRETRPGPRFHVKRGVSQAEKTKARDGQSQGAPLHHLAEELVWRASPSTVQRPLPPVSWVPGPTPHLPACTGLLAASALLT